MSQTGTLVASAISKKFVPGICTESNKFKLNKLTINDMIVTAPTIIKMTPKTWQTF